MTREFQAMLKLLKCNLRKEKADIIEGVDYKKIGTLAMQQQIMPLVFPFIEDAYNSGALKMEDEVLKNMSNRILASVAQGIRREEFLIPILDEIEKTGVKCILLKGVLLADLYPSPELRVSGDVDLYVDEKDEKTAITILKNYGFHVAKRMEGEYHSECQHNIVKSLELHVSLYEDYCTDLWFDNITFDTDKVERYTTQNGYTYNSLEKNEQLIFIILHLIKHFLSSGIGIRQIADIILYMEKYSDVLDFKKYSEIMKGLKFDYFMDCCMKIGVDYLGADQEKLFWINRYEIRDEDCERILTDIENSGLFGHNDFKRRTFGVAYTNALKQEKGYAGKKTNSGLLSKIFLDYNHIKNDYQYVNGKKWLLPVAWVHRVFRIAFCKKKEISAETANMQKEHIEFMRDMKIL